MSWSGPPVPEPPRDPFCSACREFSPIPWLPTPAGFSPSPTPFVLDEQPAAPSARQIIASAARRNARAVLLSQPPRPRWIRIITVVLRYRRDHLLRFNLQDVDMRAPGARRTECDVASVGRPCRRLVGALAVGQLGRGAAAFGNHIDVEAAAVATLICDHIALGRERRGGVVIALEGDAMSGAAARRHRIDLRGSRSIRGERQGLSV